MSSFSPAKQVNWLEWPQTCLTGIILATLVALGYVRSEERIVSEGRLTDRAYAAIVRIINDEALAVGDRLPSEARLAENFGMSRAIVREALARLASDGITEARRGAGSYVKRRPSARLDPHMPMDTLASAMGTYEVRFVLEAEAARLAAQRRSPAQMEAIERALAALRAALLSNAPAHDEDWRLHRAIVEATANASFPLVFDQLLDGVMRRNQTLQAARTSIRLYPASCGRLSLHSGDTRSSSLTKVRQ